MDVNADSNSISRGSENSDTGTHSQYRANYPISLDSRSLKDKFFKYPEGKYNFKNQTDTISL